MKNFPSKTIKAFALSRAGIRDEIRDFKFE